MQQSTHKNVNQNMTFDPIKDGTLSIYLSIDIYIALFQNNAQSALQ